MLTIRLSLARSRVIYWNNLKNGGACSMVIPRSGEVLNVVIDDEEFDQKRRATRKWIECRDAEGNRVLLHVDRKRRVDRIMKSEVRHKNAPDQIDLPL